MKALKVLSLVLLSIIITIAVDQYFFCPVYTFERTAPFSGDSIYNPYASAVPANWSKYDASPGNINLFNSLQLVSGANTVCRKSYFLPQTLSNKQHILERLNNTSPGGLIVIDYSMERSGYRIPDFSYLTHYSLLNVPETSNDFFAVWDTCLSSGKAVFIIGDDICCNVSDTPKAGSTGTWINTPNPGSDNILHALKTGTSYVIRPGESTTEEAGRCSADNVPALQGLIVKADTISAKFNLPAKTIIISGAHGLTLDTVSDTDAVVFRLAAKEPYARVTAHYTNGMEVFLNPVFRYHVSPLQQSVANIDTMLTFLLKLAGILLLAAWFGIIVIRPSIKQLRHKTLPNILLDYE